MTVLRLKKLVALGFPIELEFRSVSFCGGRETGEPGEKSMEQGEEPTTNSTHIHCTLYDARSGN